MATRPASHAAAGARGNSRRRAGSPGERPVVPAPRPETGLPPALDRILLPNARAQWLAGGARIYTPELVDSLLRLGMGGDLVSQWQLFQLMEDTWPRLNKNLLEVKRAVAALDRAVRPAAEPESEPAPAALDRADLVDRALRGFRPAAGADENGLSETVFDLMDAWSKGVSMVEIDWEFRRESTALAPGWIAPRATLWVSPGNYAYADGALALTAPGLEQPGLPPDKFLVALRKARSGILTAGALLRPLAYWWVASNFTSEWLLNYAQVFGQPIRWLTYEPSAAGMLPRLEAMLQAMGNAPWAALPAGAALQIHEAVRPAADNPQAYVRELADRLCDILILGQTLTTDVAREGAGSRALGQVHQSVRDEVITAAARWIDGVLTDQLAASIVRLNFGDARFAPQIVSAPRREPDPLAMAQRDALLLSRGVPLPRRWFYQRHGIPEPAPDDVLDTRAASSPLELPQPATP
jgi:phage gp29-like protein